MTITDDTGSKPGRVALFLYLCVAAPAIAGDRSDLATDALVKPDWNMATFQAVEWPSGQPARAPDAIEWGDDRRRSFHRDHFLPRLFGQLRGADSADPHLRAGWKHDKIRQRIERATEKAVETYLLEETPLRHVVGRLERPFQRRSARSRAPRAAPTPPVVPVAPIVTLPAQPDRRPRILRKRPSARMDFDVDLLRELPEMSFRYRRAKTVFRAKIDTAGIVRLDLQNPRWLSRGRLTSRFDPERQRITAAYRLRF